MFLLGCLPPASLTPATELANLQSPTIESVTLSCLNDEWSIELSTTSWTGNGRWWIGTTESTIEEHPIYSIGAPADGSADALYGSLSSIADWRDVVAGESTRWYCNDLEQISLLLWRSLREQQDARTSWRIVWKSERTCGQAQEKEDVFLNPVRFGESWDSGEQ